MRKGRRKFFGKTIATILGSIFPAIVSGKVTDKKKIKMLTAQGEVVEVDADIVAQSKVQGKSNKEILEWAEPILNKDSL